MSGFDRTGRLFYERTVTSNVSENGCRFQVSKPLEPGDVVAIKIIGCQDASPAANKALLFQIRWIVRENGGWLAGALKLQPESIWHTSFPPGNQKKPPAG